MKIVGLDPSLAAFGFAPDTGTACTFGVPAAKARGGVRLARFEDWFDEILPGPSAADLAVIEGYSLNPKRMKGLTGLIELGGVLRMHLNNVAIPYVVVPPGVLKRYATGNGSAPKSLMLAAARQTLGKDTTDDNEADAYWLRELGVCLSGGLHRGRAGALVGTKIQLPDGVRRIS